MTVGTRQTDGPHYLITAHLGTSDDSNLPAAVPADVEASVTEGCGAEGVKIGLRRARRHFKIRDANGVVSKEAWQLFISILQSVRDEPFEDLSLYAQNPLGGRDCIQMIRSDGGPIQAKPLSVLLDHRALRTK